MKSAKLCSQPPADASVREYRRERVLLHRRQSVPNADPLAVMRRCSLRRSSVELSPVTGSPSDTAQWLIQRGGRWLLGRLFRFHHVDESADRILEHADGSHAGDVVRGFEHRAAEVGDPGRAVCAASSTAM